MSKHECGERTAMNRTMAEECMGGFRSKTIICATAISTAVLLAAPLARAQERGPLALASASYFFVRGKIDTSVEGRPWGVAIAYHTASLWPSAAPPLRSDCNARV